MAEEWSSSSEESLDAKSDKFDPLKALYSSKTNYPVPTAPIYDNLSKYESVIKGLTGIFPTKPKKADSDPGGGLPKRRFLPHQEPVPCGSRSGRWNRGDGPQEPNKKNVLTKMQEFLGPLEMLRQCMEKRTRVKVYTRGARNIRGYVEAYVVAFDKHWNLALEDCFEVWTRRAHRKAPALGTPDGVQVEEENSCKRIVRKSNRKVETIERHVSQMLLRGEQIAIIVKID